MYHYIIEFEVMYICEELFIALCINIKEKEWILDFCLSSCYDS
jgi:hypothetical protein